MPDESAKTTDPLDELFDVLNEDGRPLGYTKRRADIHRDGDWHRAFHLWIAWRDADTIDRLLLQRRSGTKDTWPGRIDVAVGGHYRAGETLSDVLREVGEELGLVPALSDLHRLETRRSENRSRYGMDREVQDVYVLLRASLPMVRPNPIELQSVLQVRAGQLIALFTEETRTIPMLESEQSPAGEIANWRASTLSARDFVTVNDGYWLRGTRACQRLLAGGAR